MKNSLKSDEIDVQKEENKSYEEKDSLIAKEESCFKNNITEEHENNSNNNNESNSSEKIVQNESDTFSKDLDSNEEAN